MDVRKNLLDLHYNKNLQFFSITVIVILTYCIGVIIAFMSGQISVSNNMQLLVISFISLVFLLTTLFLLKKFTYHLKRIPEEIKKL